MRFLCHIIFMLSVATVIGQSLSWEGDLRTTGIISSQEVIPFWLYTNSVGEFNPATNYSGWAGLQGTYQLSENHALTAGGSFFYRDGVEKNLERKNLFLEYRNKWFKAVLGSQEQEELMSGLSTSNKNFLYSNNSRPLPGFLLQTSNPIILSKTFSLEADIAHYTLNDDRYIKDTWVHYKSVSLHIKLNEKNAFTAKIQHFAQWGGFSEEFGNLERDFSAFVKVFFAAKQAETSDEDELANALGNHLGSYFLEYRLSTKVGALSIYHDHPFEDGSGSRGINVPDGLYGVYFEPSNKKWFNGIAYEFVTTADQSGRDGGRGFDNYFNNSLYRSGWSYEKRIIGMPFILGDPELIVTANNTFVISNSANVHHFGICGSFKQIDWKLKSSYAVHNGKLKFPFEPKLKIWSNYGSVAYQLNNYGSIEVFGGLDTGGEITDVIAGGIAYHYSF